MPSSSSAELPGRKRSDWAARPAVPPMPICQLAPPSLVRLTPAPSVATSRTSASAGSTATSDTTRSGQVLSWSGVQPSPRSSEAQRPTFCEPKRCPPATSRRVPAKTVARIGFAGRPAERFSQSTPPSVVTQTSPPPNVPPNTATTVSGEPGRTAIALHEIGVGSGGIENNTAYLLLQGWSGSWFEANEVFVDQIRSGFVGTEAGQRVTLRHTFVSPGSVESLLMKIPSNTGRTSQA